MASSKFVEDNGIFEGAFIVKHCGGVLIAKFMTLLDLPVGFHQKASPCKGHVEILLQKCEN